MVVADGDTVCEPPVAVDEAQPLGDVAVQPVASVLLQVRVELSPPETELGEAVNVTVGADIRVAYNFVWSI